MEKMKVSVLGSGDVGKSFARAFSALGHDVKIGSRTPEKLNEFVSQAGEHVTSSTFKETARFGDIVVMATLGVGTEEAIRLAEPDNFRGKVVIDATNPLDFIPSGPPKLAIGHTDSLGEREFGWGAIDIGGIEGARYLEPMCMTWVLHGILSGTWNH